MTVCAAVAGTSSDAISAVIAAVAGGAGVEGRMELKMIYSVGK